jgi:uncharacterized protein involved in exopolysaccharide biosynthesis
MQAGFDPTRADEGASLIDLWLAAMRHKWLIGSLCVLGGIAGIALARVTPPLYHVEVLLAPASEVDQAGGASALGRLGGFFGAGFGLGAGQTNVYEAIAVLESRAFTERFVEENKLLTVLFADYWDAESDAWIDDVADNPPTLADASSLLDGLRQVRLDEITGLITLIIEWGDPEQAAAWANEMVAELNDRLRDRAVREAEQNLEFLRSELNDTNVVETRASIFELMEAQLRDIMLANTRREFAVKVLDPAVAPQPDEYVWPSTLHLLAGGIALGMIAGIGLAVFADLRRYLRNRQLAHEAYQAATATPAPSESDA